MNSSSEAYSRPGWKRYAWSYLSNFIVIVGSFAAYHVCSKSLGKNDLELFAVTKRVLAYGLAAVGSGWGTALAYHVARARSNEEHSERKYLYLFGRQVGAALLLLLLGAVAVPETISYLFFGKREFAYLVLPVTLEFCAVAAQVGLNSYLNGRMEIARSSLLTALCSGIFPVLSFYLFQGSLSAYFYGRAGLALFTCVAMFYQHSTSESEPPAATADGKELFRYALSRLPGALAVVGILSLPVTVATHTSPDLERAAALSICVALVQIVATGVAPISNLYLPQTAYLQARDEIAKLKPWALRLIGLVGTGTLLYVATLDYLLEPFLDLLLGRDLEGYESTIRAALPAAIPYAFFRCFQGFIDGARRKPLTTVNAFVALLVFFLAVWGASNFRWGEPSIVGFVAGTTSLGVLSLGQTVWLLKIGRSASVTKK